MTQILNKNILKNTVRLQDYSRYITKDQKNSLLKAASFLKDKKIIHVNATSIGGGVVEILKSLIPYFRSLGIQSEWYSISPDAGMEFFEITKKIHDSLQSSRLKISQKEWDIYERVNKQIAADLNKIKADILVINDPQPLLAGYLAKSVKCKIYYSHIDTSSVSEPVWSKIHPLIESYDKIVFSNKDFVHKSLRRKKIKIFTPAIDPLSQKQKIVPKMEARKYLLKYGGIPMDRPLIVQVSRFDIWKNPLGVIEAFRMVQKTYPKAHLALIGFKEAKDDPKANIVYHDVKAVANRSSDISLFFDANNLNITEFTLMAQNAADVIVQNSIKEGFGLVVSEAMWKGQAVIGGPASGIKKQIINGKNGFVAKTSFDLANKIIYLLKNDKKKENMGKEARKTVLKKFLFPRYVLDHLKLYRSCL